jgi:Ca-activated chloride channel homolog
MRRILTITSILFFLFSAIFGQTSGANTSVQKDYSESLPYKPREFENKKKKSKTDNPPKDKNENNTTVENKPVLIPVSVYDAGGRFVQGLKKSDFQVFVDDQEQDISSFEINEPPLNLVLVIDTSPSTEFNIKEIQDYALSMVEQLRPQDNVLVIAFNENVKVLSELTNDRQKISKAIRKAKVGDGTSLYDAVHNIFQKQISQIEGRRAVVLLTDGVDTTSLKARYETSLAEAEKYDAPVYPIYLDTSESMKKASKNNIPFPLTGIISSARIIGMTEAEYELGRQYLNDLVLLSGGRAISLNGLKGAKAVLPNLVEELKLQYYIGFLPAGAEHEGQRRQIKVRVNRPDLFVLARGSYVIGENGQTRK